MSAKCPKNVHEDKVRTVFGHCLDITRTPRGRADAGAPPVPSRTDPSPSREGLPPSIDSPTLSSLTRELFQLLDSGVASCSDTRSGRPWPRPRIEGIRKLVERYDEETCRLAAQEAREIVQSQDRAPNVTNLFAKKCVDVDAERSAVREEIRRALT